MTRRSTSALAAIAFVVLAVHLVAFSGATFTATKQNPANSFQTAASFCVAPGEQVLSASRDSYVDSTSAGSNFGTATQLFARPAQVLVLSQRRTVIGFNLPAVPTNCTLTASSLRLFATSPGNGRTIDVFRLNGSWTETGVTWNNVPATTGSAVSSASLGSPAYQSWNVLAQVQAMYSGTNNGFLVKDSQDSAVLSVTQTYQSREGTPTTQDPELRVTFG